MKKRARTLLISLHGRNGYGSCWWRCENFPQKTMKKRARTLLISLLCDCNAAIYSNAFLFFSMLEVDRHTRDHHCRQHPSLDETTRGPLRRACPGERHLVHVGGTRCVTWSIDRSIQIHARITWGVEFIRAIFFIFFCYV